MVKRISILIIVIFVAIISAMVVASYYVATLPITLRTGIIAVEDIHIPMELEDKLGIFFYDLDGKAYRSTEAEAFFDNNKPLIVFFNQGIDKEISAEEQQAVFVRWIECGYNVASFRGGQAYDANELVERIWTREKGIAKYNLVEVFTAYYHNFLQAHNFKGKEIRFQGVSFGSQLMVAVCSYLLKLEEADIIEDTILPDRITSLNGNFSNNSKDIYVPWWDNYIDKDAQMPEMFVEIAKNIHNRGIAVECVEGSSFGDVVENNKINFISKTTYLEYALNLGADGSTNKLIFDLYNKMLDEEIPFDYSFSKSIQLGVSPITPTSYIYARTGAKYKLEIESLTQQEYKQYSINTKVPLVAGFVFEDHNNDGNYNERIASRINGLEVELYLVDGDNTPSLIGKYTTKDDGYFQFPIEPIFIFGYGGREFFVKVNYHSQYEITPTLGDSCAYYLSTNNIKKDWESEIFLIYSKGELCIINIGVVIKR